MKRFVFLAGLLVCFAFSSGWRVSAKEDFRLAEIRQLVPKGVVLLLDSSGRTLFEHVKAETIVPASLQKILLARLALLHLGVDYRFETLFYEDPADRLVIRGKGDPFLVSEEIAYLAGEIKRLGKHRFSALVVDDSLFVDVELPGVGNSKRPHDSLNGALIVNFNTVLVKKDERGRVFSGEPQTPLTATGKRIGGTLKKGSRLRMNLGRDYLTNLKYSHEIFLSILSAEGIRFDDPAFYREPAPAGKRPFYVHRNTRSLENNLKGLLKFSNNFVANQIMLVMGATLEGFPTDLRKGLAGMNLLARRLYGAEAGKIVLREASGLSRENRISREALVKVMENFKPFAYLMPIEGETILKSGTLTGVYNYAGYFSGPSGLRTFIIHTISPKNHRDRILKLLKAYSETRLDS